MIKITILTILAIIAAIRIFSTPRKKEGGKWEAIRFITRKRKK